MPLSEDGRPPLAAQTQSCVVGKPEKTPSWMLDQSAVVAKGLEIQPDMQLSG
jgi:hypothetical protein